MRKFLIVWKFTLAIFRKSLREIKLHPDLDLREKSLPTGFYEVKSNKIKGNWQNIRPRFKGLIFWSIFLLFLLNFIKI